MIFFGGVCSAIENHILQLTSVCVCLRGGGGG